MSPPAPSRLRHVWIGGSGLPGCVLPETEARISPFDHGLLTGDGVFETLRVYGGRPFAWKRHLARLRRSADGLGLAVPDRHVLVEAADAVLTANALLEARLRITVTGGPAPLGSDRGTDGPTVVVAATSLAPMPASTAVVTVEWPRNERGALAGLKTTSYGENVRALARAAAAGAGEAIFPNTRGELCEGTGTNVFLVRGGRVVTPPESSGCLAGVSRALVLELCPSIGVEGVEESLPLEALFDVDEAFLTSTTREVQSISAVDGRAVGGPAPGAVTARLATAFCELVARDIDP